MTSEQRKPEAVKPAETKAAEPKPDRPDPVKSQAIASKAAAVVRRATEARSDREGWVKMRAITQCIVHGDVRQPGEVFQCSETDGAKLDKRKQAELLLKP